MTTFYSHQMDVVKNIFDMDKIEIFEEHLEMNVDPDDIHEVRDIYRLFNAFLYNMLDHIYIDYDYLMCKFEFNNDDLYSLSNRKIEIIRLVLIRIPLWKSYSHTNDMALLKKSNVDLV